MHKHVLLEAACVILERGQQYRGPQHCAVSLKRHSDETNDNNAVQYLSAEANLR